jgi:hypothetical protein
MTLLRTIQAEGYDEQFFKIHQSESTFYTFDAYKPSQHPDYWNIVGINNQINTQKNVEIQLLYIDREALEYREFSALKNAEGFLSLYFSELQAFISLFDQNFELVDISQEKELFSFSLMQAEDLAKLHFSEKEIRQRLGRYYYYHPALDIQPQEKVSIIGLPSWASVGKSPSLAILLFATFDRHRLEDPTFRLWRGEWLGSMLFDLDSLSEFIFLLKQQEKSY